MEVVYISPWVRNGRTEEMNRESVGDDSFKPPLAIKHINDPVKERGRS